MSPADNARLGHILRACKVIIKGADVSRRDEIDLDDQLIDGLIHQIQKIGEAAKLLSQEVRDDLAHIPWKKYMRTRDILTHRYYEVDNDIVWRIMLEEVPRLQVAITSTFPEISAQ